MRQLRKSVVISALTAFSCKPQPTTPTIRFPSTKPVDPMAGFYASSQTENRAKNNFYFALFNTDYVVNFDALPASGQVTDNRIPYVGGWYPQNKGGTNVPIRGETPLAKYDAVFNANTSRKAVEWERTNHTVPAGDSSSGWAGHCNGFSAAATRHAEPKHKVERGSTVFYPEDIKALLAEIHMGAKFYFLGGNRCGLVESGSLTPPGIRQDQQTMGACDDVNPGTFHVAVANWIGIQKYPLIFDISGKEQVWNYPHWKYSVDSRPISKTEANSIITGSQSTEYRFNPAATKFRSVAMTVTRSDAVTTETMTASVDLAKRYIKHSYYYILELNDNNDIIGGEWVSESQRNHPDFIWVALEPVPGDGSKYSANANLDPNEVLKLWAESVDADPANPPKTLKEPSVLNAWGQFPKFDIQINGAQSGVAFVLNGKMAVTLKPKSGLTDAAATMTLDGSRLTADASGLSAQVDNPVPGIHVLEVAWSRGGKVVDTQRARIHVIR